MPTRLRRSREDRLIVGVCAGLARYLGVDVILVRGAFAVLFVLTLELAVLLYIGLWFLMAEEDEDAPVVAQHIPLKRAGEDVPASGKTTP